MSLPNYFDPITIQILIDRIHKLTPDSQRLRWKMSVDQMLAHCNVTYEYIFEPTKYKKPNFFMKLILKLFAKPYVVNEAPYKHNGPTWPDFIITDHKNFEQEKNRLISFIRQTEKLWASHFDGLESHSFGVLSKQEWSNMLYKHLDHHLGQFGV